MTTEAETPGFDITARVEILEPVDRIRGTIVNATPSIFVVHYDNGDYVAYPTEEAGEFKPIPLEPIPSHAREEIVRIRRQLGRTPPEDAQLLRPVRPKRKKVPRQADAGETLTGTDAASSIEA